MAIRIPVSASIDPSAVSAEIERLGQSIARANKTKYEPVSPQSLRNLAEMERRMQNLLRVNREMARRVRETGQEGKSFFELDFTRMYENNSTRAKKMAQAFQYVTGGSFAGGTAAGGGGSGRPPMGPVASAFGGAAQAGLRAASGATGGVGGVAASSLGAGMSAGVGAGLAGLLGGILALGVGKIVGAATEKIEEAESNAWAHDQLKRIVGDVQVSFKALQGSINSASDNIHVTYTEGAKLATQFAKQGNVSAGQYDSIHKEIGIGGGLSRAYGLDPSQGVGFMGQMRGMRLTQDEQGSRRMALIIGETIAKSNAFAKADEVMDAIAGYATSQARSSMSANANGYAGALAGLAGSGMVGLDVNGSANILNRVNSALTSGGAKGEQSQFFSAMIGAKHGLDPFQLQMWREGGAFNTLDKTFGGGSMASEFGMNGPGGTQTWMEASLEELKSRYGDNKGMLANATANHLGLNMSQAMAVLKYQPKELGAIGERLGRAGFDLKDLNASAIGTLGKIETGDADTLKSIAGNMLERTDLPSGDRAALKSQLESGSIDKDFLMRLVASREQEQTDGKNIHDSKVALDNIKTSMADKLIPLTQSIRDGILYMAGGRGEKGQYEVTKDIEKLNSDERLDRIGRIADADEESAKSRGEEDKMALATDPNRADMKGLPWWDAMQKKIKDGTATEKEIKSFQDMAMVSQGTLSSPESVEIQKKMNEVDDRVNAELQDIRRRREADTDAEKRSYEKRLSDLDKADREQVSNSRSLRNDPNLRRDVAAAEKEIGAPDGLLWAQMEQESSFNPNAVSPAGAMGLAQVMPKTLRSLEKRFGRTLNPYDPKDAVLIQKEVMRENKQHFGSWDDALKAYNGGWNESRWSNSETSNYAPMIYKRQDKWGGTPLPDDGSGRDRDNTQKFIFDDLNIFLKNEKGESVRPPLKANPRLATAQPFGTERRA